MHVDRWGNVNNLSFRETDIFLTVNDLGIGLFSKVYF